MKSTNDYRKACLYGHRLKTWESAVIANWARPVDIKYEATAWSFISTLATLTAISSAYYFSGTNDNVSPGFYSKMMRFLRGPSVVVLQILSSEVMEITIQTLYLFSISSGDHLERLGLIRLHLLLICTNIILYSISLVKCVTT